jgi:hypothetical protein
MNVTLCQIERIWLNPTSVRGVSGPKAKPKVIKAYHSPVISWVP